MPIGPTAVRASWGTFDGLLNDDKHQCRAGEDGHCDQYFRRNKVLGRNQEAELDPEPAGWTPTLQDRNDCHHDERRQWYKGQNWMGETLAHHVGRESIDQPTQRSCRTPHLPLAQDHERGGRRDRHAQHHQQVRRDQRAKCQGNRRSDQSQERGFRVLCQVYAGRSEHGVAEEGIEAVGERVGHPSEVPHRQCQIALAAEDVVRDLRHHGPVGDDAKDQVRSDHHHTRQRSSPR